MNDRPTAKMLNYVHNLAERLHIEDRYAWDTMSYDECSELIEELKDRLGVK